MILKYLFLSLLTTWLITSSDPFYGTNFTSYKEILNTTAITEHSWRTTKIFDKYLFDEDDRISKEFKLKPYYYPNVQFWFLIYTQFSSSQVLIHDKSNLKIIYRVLDFEDLANTEVNRNVRYVVQQKAIKEKMNEIKNLLDDSCQNPYSLTPEAKEIYRLLRDSNVKIPLKSLERKAFFNQLRDNIRSQTGQKDYIRAGVIRAKPYRSFLTKYFKARDLPLELLAIPFLESSFNPIAHSRVSALGVWQFMPLIASYYMPKRSAIDYRSNIGVASISAASLLKENKNIMKSWDLAVTAYNSGTKYLLKTKRNISPEADLEDIIKNGSSGHFGFASKNFYSEFLALTVTLAYQEELFSLLHQHERDDVDNELRFYLTKCSLRMEKVLTDKESDDVLFHNHQLKDLNKYIPKGAIITTKGELPLTKFHELNFDKVLKHKSKMWEQFVRNQSCSTK